jgi:O-antigen/teichoic acid export membrane protein
MSGSIDAAIFTHATHLYVIWSARKNRGTALHEAKVSSSMKSAAFVSTLRNKIGGETSVVAATMATQTGMRIVNSMILTRLLSSEAFGVIGVITSVLVTFGLVSDIGISAFIVRHRGVQDEHYINELWTLRLIRSIALTVAVVLLSRPIALWLGKPELQYAIALSSLTFVIDGLDSLGAILALRGRQIRRLSQLDLLTQLFNLGVTILLAIFLRSFWAILAGNLVGQMLKVWLSYYMFPGVRHRWRFSRDRAAEMWKFSKFITASTILTLVISQADKVILAKIFPLKIFGLYVLAAGLASVPAGVAGVYGNRILLPRFGETARNAPELLAKEFYAQRLNVHLVYAAFVGFLAGCGPLLFHILYDPRYQDAVFYFQILLVGSFFSLGNLAANEVMIVSGKSHFTLTTNMVRLGYFAIAGFFAYRFQGAVGLIYVVASIELVAQLYGWIVLRVDRLLNIYKELAIVSLGIAGLAAGALVDAGAIWALRLIDVKI